MSRNAKKPQEITTIAELSSQQHMVIFHIIGGKTQTDAANEVGVDPATVSRWKQEPSFLAELNRRTVELFDSNHAELLALAADARQVLRESMERGPNRLKAAIYILDRLGDKPAAVTVEDIQIEQKQAEMERFYRGMV